MTTTRQAGVAALFVSASCEGETCMCGQPAVRKIGEEIPRDDPLPHRHNLTAYVCAEHYAMLLGPRAARSVGVDWKAPASDLEQVIQEREGLKDALEPFRLAAENMDGDEPDTMSLWESPEAMMLTFGDLRRVAAILSRLDKPNG